MTKAKYKWKTIKNGFRFEDLTSIAGEIRKYPNGDFGIRCLM